MLGGWKVGMRDEKKTGQHALCQAKPPLMWHCGWECFCSLSLPVPWFPWLTAQGLPQVAAQSSRWCW